MPGLVNKALDFVSKHPAVATAAKIVAGAALGSAAVFSVVTSDGISLFGCYTGTGCVVGTLAVTDSLTAPSLTLDGTAASSGTLVLRQVTFFATGTGGITATGTNVTGYWTPHFSGKIVNAYAELSEPSDDNLTTVDVNINDASIFTTGLTIDPTETGSYLAATPKVINSAANTFSPNNKISLDVLAPSNTPGSDLKVDLILLVTGFNQ